MRQWPAFGIGRRGACWRLPRRVRLLLFARPVLAVAGFRELLLTQYRASIYFHSEKSRLKLARDLGSGKRLPDDAVWVLEIEPLHSVSVRFVGGLLGPLVGDPVTFDTWWLGHHRISMRMPGSLARRMAICLLAMMAYP